MWETQHSFIDIRQGKVVRNRCFTHTFMPPMAANCSRIVGQSRTRVKKQRAGSESDGGLHQPPAGKTRLVFS